MNSIQRTGFCTRCGGIRDLRIEVQQQETQGLNGKVVFQEIATAHCENCGSFVMKEIQEISPDRFFELQAM